MIYTYLSPFRPDIKFEYACLMCKFSLEHFLEIFLFHLMFYYGFFLEKFIINLLLGVYSIVVFYRNRAKQQKISNIFILFLAILAIKTIENYCYYIHVLDDTPYWDLEGILILFLINIPFLGLLKGLLITSRTIENLKINLLLNYFTATDNFMFLVGGTLYLSLGLTNFTTLKVIFNSLMRILLIYIDHYSYFIVNASHLFNAIECFVDASFSMAFYKYQLVPSRDISRLPHLIFIGSEILITFLETTEFKTSLSQNLYYYNSINRQKLLLALIFELVIKIIQIRTNYLKIAGCLEKIKDIRDLELEFRGYSTNNLVFKRTAELSKIVNKTIYYKRVLKEAGLIDIIWFILNNYRDSKLEALLAIIFNRRIIDIDLSILRYLLNLDSLEQIQLIDKIEVSVNSLNRLDCLERSNSQKKINKFWHYKQIEFFCESFEIIEEIQRIIFKRVLIKFDQFNLADHLDSFKKNLKILICKLFFGLILMLVFALEFSWFIFNNFFNLLNLHIDLLIKIALLTNTRANKKPLKLVLVRGNSRYVFKIKVLDCYKINYLINKTKKSRYVLAKTNSKKTKKK